MDRIAKITARAKAEQPNHALGYRMAQQRKIEPEVAAARERQELEWGLEFFNGEGNYA